MNDVVIRKCTLRIVRHGGWSWGPDRRALLNRATSELPRLVAERLAELLGDAEGEITQPVKLRFTLRAGQLARDGELANVVRLGIRPESIPLPALPESRPEIESAEPSDSREQDQRSDARGPEADAAPAPALTTPTRMLLEWRAQRELWQRLQGFSSRALDLWLEALLENLRAPSNSRLSMNDLRQECAAIRDKLPTPISDAVQLARARLAIAVEMAARHPQQVAGESILLALDELVPKLPAATVRDDDAALAAQAAVVARRDSRDAEHADLRATPLSSPGDRTRVTEAHESKVCTVLPYIVLGVLHRLGWLDVASATFAALRDSHHGSAFASALAYKLLPPPERGWHRAEEARRTAAVFAGVRVPPSPLELSHWSRNAADALSPIDDFIRDSLARGHDLQLPLLVTRVDTPYDRPWLLLDADGRIPVAWARDEAAVRASLRRFGPCIVLVSTAAATPEMTRGLASDGRSFLTTATPGRNESHWRRVRGTACWTGGAETTTRRLTEAAGLFPELEALALSVTRELLNLRPAAVPGEGTDLEHSAALAAGTALGALSWMLWRERETVHPLLALERFANFDGTARVTQDAVEVRPAFGRRYLDLQKHGLLAEIPAPPWLGGRRIVFAGP